MMRVLLVVLLLAAVGLLQTNSTLLEGSTTKELNIYRARVRVIYDLLAKECHPHIISRRQTLDEHPDQLQIEMELYRRLFKELTECRKKKAGKTTSTITRQTTSTTEIPTMTTEVKPITTPTTEQPTTTTKVKLTTTPTTEQPITTTKVKPTTTPTTEQPTTTTKVKPTTTPTTEQPTTTTKVKLTTTPTTEQPTTTTKVKLTTTPTTEQPTTTTKVKPTTTPTTEQPTTTTKVKLTTTPTTEQPTATTKVKLTTTPTTEQPTTTTKVKLTATPTTEQPTTTTKVKPTTIPQPIECQQATNYTQSWRRDRSGSDIRPGGPNSQNGYACDFHASNSWFRFTGEAGNRMLDRCPKEYSCGTEVPYWTDAEMPEVVGVWSTVFAYGVDGSYCKGYTQQVKVMRCSKVTEHDFIYKQTTNWAGTCVHAFCGMM